MFLCAHAFSSCVHFAVVSGYDCVDVLQDILRDHIEQSKLSPAACHPEVSSALRARSQSCFAPDLASKRTNPQLYVKELSAAFCGK